MTRRTRSVTTIVGATAVILLAALAYAYFVEPYRLYVNRQEMGIEGWDAEFDGFRAVLISDLHGGSHGGDLESIRRVVEAANAENADAVFLLGDFVSTYPDRKAVKMPPAEVANTISGLEARFGVFAVLGNHDGWLGDENVASELQRVGIRVLNGEVAFIERNGRRIRILGLKDHLKIVNWDDFSDDAKRMLAASEGTGNVIALEHSPDVLPMITGGLAISNDLKILFAGHTHGGQVWLPFVGRMAVPSMFGQKYAAGHIRDGSIDMFVTTGTGTSILPFRFMVPPEIAVVIIKSKNG